MDAEKITFSKPGTKVADPVRAHFVQYTHVHRLKHFKYVSKCVY